LIDGQSPSITPQQSTVLFNRLVIIAQKKMKSIVFIPFLVSAMTRCNAFTFTARYPKVSSRRSSSSSSLIAASSSSTQSDIIHIGLIGGGTVGGGICEILEKKQAYLTSLTGKSLHVKSICVRDVSKPRDFTIPPGCQVHTDPQIILSDPDIDIVVEVMGGTTLAKDLVFQALSKGKHVVTANKALIAITATFAAGFALLLFVFIRQALRNTGKDQESANKLNQLKASLQNAIGKA
jgi:hypothetical protein